MIVELLKLQKNGGKKVARKSTYYNKKSSKRKKFNKALTIAIICIVVILIIALTVTYFIKPDLLQYIINLFKEPEGGSSIKGITPIEGDKAIVTVIDVGQGDCILLEMPDGKNMIIDIGSVGGKKACWDPVDNLLKSKEITTLDYVMITHTDSDHISELVKLCENYEIKNFYIPKTTEFVTQGWAKSQEAINSETFLNENGRQNSIINYNIGKFVIEGENWKMDCFSYDEKDYPNIKSTTSAEKKNSISPITIFQYGGRSIALTGDANEETEEYIISKGYLDDVDVDVLKVGHHGSKSSTTDLFLEKIDAEYAIISVGEGNSHNHPTPQLVDRLLKYKDIVKDNDIDGFDMTYRTDKDGDVVVQMGSNSVINVISEKLEDNNRTQTAVTAVMLSTNHYVIIVNKFELPYDMVA